jgi:hypothetical protein
MSVNMTDHMSVSTTDRVPNNTFGIILVLLLIIIILLASNYWMLSNYQLVSNNNICPQIIEPRQPPAQQPVDQIPEAFASRPTKYSNGFIGLPKMTKPNYYDQIMRGGQNAFKQPIARGSNNIGGFGRANAGRPVERFEQPPQRVDQQDIQKEAEKEKVRFVIYHMQGCGHCSEIMDVKQSNGRTKFEDLQNRFNGDQRVKIVAMQYGRDPVPQQITGFPTIHLITKDGTNEYNQPRDVDSMKKEIEKYL